MTIYIESFLIQNILINFCLLKLVKITTHCKTSFFKMLLSSIVGAAFSVFVVIFLKNNLLHNIVKLLCGILMILLAFKGSKKQTIFNFILLFIYTYAFGGFITSISSKTFVTSFGIVTASKFSIELVCVIIIALTFIFEKVTKHIKFKIKTNNLIYPITLFSNGKSLKINAYLDTGNLLNYSGLPVVIINLDSFLKLNNINLIEYLTLNCEKILTNTVTGSKQLNMFKIDKLELKIDGKTRTFTSPYVAVNRQFTKTNYDALLGPLFFNN